MLRSVAVGFLLCLSLTGQTRVRFSQIRNWRQVSPNEILPAAHAWRRPGVALSQLAWSGPSFVESWKKTATYLRDPDGLSISWDPENQQDNPILITCLFGSSCYYTGLPPWAGVVPGGGIVVLNAPRPELVRVDSVK